MEIVEPELSPEAQVANAPVRRSACVVGLPQGSWTLIGATPGEVNGVHHQQSGGALARCSFKPVWAIQVGAGPGAKVAALGPLPAPKSVKLNVSGGRRAGPKLVEVWAGAIYNAQIRRPKFCRLSTDVGEEAIMPMWNEYVTQAKFLKRAMKRR